MPPIIKELWIFSNAGIPIVEISKETKLNKYLMGSFISAIRSCSQHLSEKGLNSFIMENYKFILKSVLDSNAILVCMCDTTTKDKKIHKQCDVIARIFEEIYEPEEIKNWNGDVAFFDKFKEKLELYFRMSNL